MHPKLRAQRLRRPPIGYLRRKAVHENHHDQKPAQNPTGTRRVTQHQRTDDEHLNRRDENPDPHVSLERRPRTAIIEPLQRRHRRENADDYRDAGRDKQTIENRARRMRRQGHTKHEQLNGNDERPQEASGTSTHEFRPRNRLNPSAIQRGSDWRQKPAGNPRIRKAHVNRAWRSGRLRCHDGASQNFAEPGGRERNLCE